MTHNNQTRLKVLAGGNKELKALHDKVMALLETREKKGIMDLLKNNNESCKKLLFPYINSSNQAVVMTALTGILEAHARECYTIGYLDCIANRNSEIQPEVTDP